MNRSLSTLTATAFLLASALGLAQAQSSGDDETMQPEQGTAEQGQQGQGMMHQREGMMEGREESRKPGKHRYRHSGMMRHHGDYMRHGMGHGREEAGHRVAMQIFFAVTDANGDGTLSLQEVQDTHARIFAHVDADDDGQVTKGEIRAFFHVGRRGRGAIRSEMSDDPDMMDDPDMSDDADE